MKLRANGEGRVYRPPQDKARKKGMKTWYIQWTDTSKPKGKQQVRESSKSEKKAEALKLLRSRLEAVAHGRAAGPDIDRTTIGDLRSMIINKFIEKNRRSIKRLYGALLHLTGDDRRPGYFSPIEKASTVTEDRISAYIAARLSERAAGGTINRELTTLRRMYRLGLRAKKVASVPTFDMLGEATPRAGFFEPADSTPLKLDYPSRSARWLALLTSAAGDWRLRSSPVNGGTLTSLLGSSVLTQAKRRTARAACSPSLLSYDAS